MVESVAGRGKASPSVVAAPDAALFDPPPVPAGGRAGPGGMVGTHSRLLLDPTWLIEAEFS